MYARSALRVMLDDSYVPAALPRELIAPDRIMLRWAVSNGSGLPSEDWDDRPVSRIPPLDDGTAVVVDQIVLHSPPKTQKFVRLWYKSPIPVRLIADRMHMPPRRAYQTLGVVLHYLRWRFQESKYPDLVRILETRL